jgi:hypothetical protein
MGNAIDGFYIYFKQFIFFVYLYLRTTKQSLEPLNKCYLFFMWLNNALSTDMAKE